MHDYSWEEVVFLTYRSFTGKMDRSCYRWNSRRYAAPVDNLGLCSGGVVVVDNDGYLLSWQECL